MEAVRRIAKAERVLQVRMTLMISNPTPIRHHRARSRFGAEEVMEIA